jgi:hypothetical protein
VCSGFRRTNHTRNYTNTSSWVIIHSSSRNALLLPLLLHVPDVELQLHLFFEHVDIIVASSVKTLGFIFRSCKRFRSESCRSKLEYCSIVWSPIYRRGVDALESVQRKFAKYLLFKLIAEFPPRGTPNSVLYDMANLRSLNMRRNDSFLIFLYKIIHGIINSPFLLSQIYFNVPRANLRSGRFFYVPRAVTNILHRSPLYTACTLFNSNCSECDIFVISLGQFKRLIIVLQKL